MLCQSKLDICISRNNLMVNPFVIINISPLQSTAGRKPLQFRANSLDPRLLASSSCRPSCPNRHTTWPKGIIISLLMFEMFLLLGHSPFLRITHIERAISHHAGSVLSTTNAARTNGDVSSDAQRSSRLKVFGYSSVDRP
jgi:hypothetical protein